MRHGVWRAVPHWRKYCLTKQTATHDTRLRRACSAVKPLLQNSRRFFFANPGKGQSVGLAIFYEIFYEKSTLFLQKERILPFFCKCPSSCIFFKLPRDVPPKGTVGPGGVSRMLLSQLARNMPSVQRKTPCPQFCYFFHNICPHPADDKSPALTYTAHAALRIRERLLRTQPFLS